MRRGITNQLHLQQPLFSGHGFEEETLVLAAWRGVHTTRGVFYFQCENAGSRSERLVRDVCTEMHPEAAVLVGKADGGLSGYGQDCGGCL